MVLVVTNYKSNRMCQHTSDYFSILHQHLRPFGQVIYVLFEEVGYSFNNSSMTERSWGRSSLMAEKTTASSIFAYS